MRFSRSALVPALLALLAVGAGSARAGADPLPGPSPFLPAAGAGATPTQDAALELRGVVTDGNQTLFSIYDPARHISWWVHLKENTAGFAVRSYDAAHDNVTVDYQGRDLTLALHTAKIAGAPAAAPQAMPVMASAPNQPPIGGPVILHPSPSDEQRRLEAIAAEVNRRRLLRQQALQASRRAEEPGNRGGPPGPPQGRRQ